MITAWTSHLTDPEEKKKFEGAVRSARIVLERLQTLMSDDLTAINNKESSIDVYSNPNWDYRQAHANGHKACLKSYIKLLTLDPKEK